MGMDGVVMIDEGLELGIQSNSSRTPGVDRKEGGSAASFSRKSRCYFPFVVLSDPVPPRTLQII
jgi:hypothetical protein